MPFKPNVPLPTVKFPSSALKWSTKQLQMAVVPEAVRRVGPHVWWCYKQVFGFIWLLLLLTPMMVLCAVIWILMAAGVHMVNYPEALISSGFNVAGSVPDYMKWAAGHRRQTLRERVFQSLALKMQTDRQAAGINFGESPKVRAR